MKLGTHMPDGERRKHIDMRFVGQRSRSQLLKIEQKLDTCKYQIFVLFLEVVTLTFDLQTSIGFLLSPSGMCVPRFI
jgi:hypothetical protein